jgi:hypothetical protein
MEKSHYPVLDGLRGTAAFSLRTTHPSPLVLALAAAVLYCGVTLFALALSRWYDRPVRAWLTRIYLERETATARLGNQVPL